MLVVAVPIATAARRLETNRRRWPRIERLYDTLARDASQEARCIGYRTARMARIPSRTAFAAVLLAAVIASSSALYLPGVTPVDYRKGAIIPLKVRQLTSNHDLAYAYYDAPFCKVRAAIVGASAKRAALRAR